MRQEELRCTESEPTWSGVQSLRGPRGRVVYGHGYTIEANFHTDEVRREVFLHKTTRRQERCGGDAQAFEVDGSRKDSIVEDGVPGECLLGDA